MGLRLKLLVFVVGFVLAVAAIYGLTTLRSQEEIYRREMVNRGEAVVRAFALATATATANRHVPLLDDYVEKFSALRGRLDLRYLAVLDHQGSVLAHTDLQQYGKVYDDPFTRRARASVELIHQIEEREGELLLEVAAPAQSGLRWGTVLAGFTLANMQNDLAQSRQSFLLLALALALASGSIAFLGLSMLVVRPVLRMRGMAQRFGEGRLGERVQLRQRDEMGQLASQLNAMAQQIQDYTGSLEQLVEARTAELASANTKLVEANVQLDRLAKTDPLTGLYNRRQFMEQLEFEVRRGARNPHQFTLIILDVDHFKKYNDTHGHTAGDELLQRMAALLQLNLRGTDLVARYGGEEFVVLLLDTGPEEGFATAKKLQQVVFAQPFPKEETQPLGAISISVGVAFYPMDSRDGRKLIDYADRALYKSKERGRNTVTRWSEIQEDTLHA